MKGLAIPFAYMMIGLVIAVVVILLVVGLVSGNLLKWASWVATVAFDFIPGSGA